MALFTSGTKTKRIGILTGITLGLFLLAALPALPGRTSAAAQPGPDKEPAPLTERQKKVLKSLQMGIDHLRGTQNPQGTWLRGPKHPVGYAAMPALALLEVGVPADDAVIQRAAKFVRGNSARMDETYEIALSILFLNRLGDAKDVPLIRSLALRLIAGQCPQGGWSYRCPVLNEAQEKQLLIYLEKNPPPFSEADTFVMHPFLRPIPKSMEALVDPFIRKEREASLAELYAKPPMQDKDKMTIPTLVPKESKYDPTKPGNQQPGYDPGRGTDSQTKPDMPPSKPSDGIPTEKDGKKSKDGPKSKDADPFKLKDGLKPKDADPFKLKDGSKPKDADPFKLKDAQKPSTGLKPSGPPQPRLVPIYQWPTLQTFVKQMLLGANTWAAAPPPVEDNSNTQFAILGLWAARKHGLPMALTLVRLDQRFRTNQLADGAWSYFAPGGMVHPKNANLQKGTPAMTCVGLMGLGVAHGAFQEAALAQKKNPAPADFLFDPAIQKGLTSLSRSVDPRINFEGARVNLYFFWSLERTMVMYQLPTLGGHDWHEWGTDILLSRQTAGGSWDEHGYPGSSEPIDTSMALLFLSRANLNRDLSESLRRYLVVVDPAKVKGP